jgi:hypothetical protein
MGGLGLRSETISLMDIYETPRAHARGISPFQTKFALNLLCLGLLCRL